MKRLLGSLLFWAAVLIVVGSALLYSAAPFAAREGTWCHVVLRNWEECGFFALKGKLVINLGGLGATTAPFIYAGHRPVGLYPAFLVGHLTGGAGEGDLLFYMLFSFLIAVSIWLIFQRNVWGVLIASATVLSAGYVRTTVVLDLLGIPVLLGIPFMLAAISLLSRDRITVRGWAALALATAVYAAVNWTAVFSVAIGVAFLIIGMRSRPYRWICFASIAGLAVAATAFVSVSEKASGSSGASSSFSYFYNAYLFGPGGYAGYPMTWGRAIIRIVAANCIGLLPLIGLYIWLQIRGIRSRGAIALLASFPLAVALLTIAGMRNYFAAHPWMAAPVLIVGFVFSMCLLQRTEVGAPVSAERLRPVHLAFSLISLAYACLVVMFLRFNSADEEALLQLVRNNTGRRDVIMYSGHQDPWLAYKKNELQALFDRLMVEENEQIGRTVTEGDARYMLTGFPEKVSGKVIAASVDAEALTPGFARQALALYRTHIAKRTPGDRLELGRKYYLCQVWPSRSAHGAGPHESAVHPPVRPLE